MILEEITIMIGGMKKKKTESWLEHFSLKTHLLSFVGNPLTTPHYLLSFNNASLSFVL